MTSEAEQAFASADVALYLVADLVAEAWIATVNPSARSLLGHYREGASRQAIYDDMVETILAEVRSGANVCVAFYGHPGVFVSPSHAAIERARAEGHTARMLPAVSSEDCLFADLGVDPGVMGCQSYEATDFLLRRRQVDPTAMLILWQIAVIGIRAYSREFEPAGGLGVLRQYLSEWYEEDHEVTLYEASPYPLAEPAVRSFALRELPASEPAALATLYVPPVGERAPDPDMIARLTSATDAKLPLRS
jgi:uncharacterized protein YabN with tetrapyrrole methylase and pyrophosphatase domain